MKIKNPQQFLENARIVSEALSVSVVSYAKIMGVVLTVGSAGIAGIAGLNFETAGAAPLDQRPSLELSSEGISGFYGKIARLGEFDSAIPSLTTYANLFRDWNSLAPSLSRPRGFSAHDESLSLSDKHDVCMVSTRQHSSFESGFYEFSKVPYLAEKAKMDFFIQSHETSHCSFSVKATISNEKDLRDLYLLSVNEVAADLAAALDYMRVTGTNDLYHDVIRPMRVADISSLGHTTRAALDVILRDVNPEGLQLAVPADIPHLVNHLMQKHMMLYGDGYDVFAHAETLDNDMMRALKHKPAALALLREIGARAEIARGNMDDALAVDLRKEIKKTLTGQLLAYGEVVPEAILKTVTANQARLYDKLRLDAVNADPSVERKARMDKDIDGKSVMDYFLSSTYN